MIITTSDKYNRKLIGSNWQFSASALGIMRFLDWKYPKERRYEIEEDSNGLSCLRYNFEDIDVDNNFYLADDFAKYGTECYKSRFSKRFYKIRLEEIIDILTKNPDEEELLQTLTEKQLAKKSATEKQAYDSYIHRDLRNMYTNLMPNLKALCKKINKKYIDYVGQGGLGVYDKLLKKEQDLMNKSKKTEIVEMHQERYNYYLKQKKDFQDMYQKFQQFEQINAVTKLEVAKQFFKIWEVCEYFFRKEEFDYSIKDLFYKTGNLHGMNRITGFHVADGTRKRANMCFCLNENNFASEEGTSFDYTEFSFIVFAFSVEKFDTGFFVNESFDLNNLKRVNDCLRVVTDNFKEQDDFYKSVLRTSFSATERKEISTTIKKDYLHFSNASEIIKFKKIAKDKSYFETFRLEKSVIKMIQKMHLTNKQIGFLESRFFYSPDKEFVIPFIEQIFNKIIHNFELDNEIMMAFKNQYKIGTNKDMYESNNKKLASILVQIDKAIKSKNNEFLKKC